MGGPIGIKVKYSCFFVTFISRWSSLYCNQHVQHIAINTSIQHIHINTPQCASIQSININTPQHISPSADLPMQRSTNPVAYCVSSFHVPYFFFASQVSYVRYPLLSLVIIGSKRHNPQLATLLDYSLLREWIISLTFLHFVQTTGTTPSMDTLRTTK
jgi:hypothetical protein